MDPLSIATAVVGLTATCLSTCKKLHDLAGSYVDVPIIVAAICSESTIIGIGLSELQTKILQRDDLAQAWASRAEIWAAFEMALTGCMVVFSCLEAETRHLQSKNSGVWAKIKFMWNHDRLKELLAQLRGQQTDTLSSMQKDIRQNARMMQNTAAEAQSLQSRTPSIRLQSQSIFDNDTSRLSFFEFEIVSGIAPSELDFEFDDVVVNSKVYRRELHKAKAKNERISAPETADGDPDPDTITLRGNDPDVEIAQTLILDRSSSTDIAEGLEKEIVHRVSKTEDSLDEEQKAPSGSQNRNIPLDNLSSIVVCCKCDGSPDQAAIFGQQYPYYLHKGLSITGNWDVSIPVSFEGRQYIDSLNNGSFDDHIDIGIQEQHDSYLEQIHDVGSELLYVFKNNLTNALQSRVTGKDRIAAFESWTIMLESAFQLFRLSEELLTPEAAHTTFVNLAETFHQSLAQPVSGYEILAPTIAQDTTVMLGSIFRANLDVLLKQSNGDASWDKDNQKLDSFLANADVMESLDFPLGVTSFWPLTTGRRYTCMA
ncbi:hypothetical protein FAVG1_08883 [Fusarium avenaceum]|nr:hypothetical protein FAVG1_08883 [Fusarium avenaceum]